MLWGTPIEIYVIVGVFFAIPLGIWLLNEPSSNESEGRQLNKRTDSKGASELIRRSEDQPKPPPRNFFILTYRKKMHRVSTKSNRRTEELCLSRLAIDYW